MHVADAPQAAQQGGKTQAADKHDSTPDWLNDDSLAAFMATIEEPQAVAAV